MEKKNIKFAIGFATGRKNFRKVLNAYIYSWNEFMKRNQQEEKISLNLFVAYDLTYSDAQSTDFTNLPQEVVNSMDEIVFLGAKNALRSVQRYVNSNKLTKEEARLLFGAGYAGKRNAILYAAIEHGMDYLLYLDDDEYPVAVTNNSNICLWSGQYVLPLHLQYIKEADITNGYHCGYISPIPQIDFNQQLTEETFARFIHAISNDIIFWDSIRSKMETGGVTYADTEVLQAQKAVFVEEENGCKFISGSNLCINLTNPSLVQPFYNPYKARGEDTFLSTLLSDRVVKRIPCYTFHDGFSSYRHLLDGVLPLHLKPISILDEASVTRFLNACIGWIRYKPLLVYLCNPQQYEAIMQKIDTDLEAVLPDIAAHFQRDAFMTILYEFQKYRRLAPKHAKQFQDTQKAWKKILSFITE